MADQYDSLSREQLAALLRQRDAAKKLGLVWERNDIEADAAVDANFVAATLVPELCDRPAPWRNLVIEGDNFDGLRWLRMTLAGRVKCITIDPPYNTGNKDWVYNDHYIDADDRYRHSTWLEFLYRRLSLARDLLAPDGVILVNINEENRSRLDLLMDEVFPGMRSGSFVWRTRPGGNEGNRAFISDNHEYVLVYSNPEFRFRGSEKSFSLYSNPDNDPNGDWTSGDITVNVAYQDKRAGQAYYPIQDPKTGFWYPCNPDAVWRYASSAKSSPKARLKTKFMEQWIEEERVLFPRDCRVETYPTRESLDAAIAAGEVPKSGKSAVLRPDLPDLDFWVGKPIAFGTPRFKRYKKDLKSVTQPLSSWITPKSEADTADDDANMIIAGTNDEAAKVIKEVFGSKAFNYAKPVSLIRELVRQSTGPGDIVLDFFAGSATSAQAVMELNAEDGGDRRFIMVSSTEATPQAPDRNICRDVTAERIRRLNAMTEGKYAALDAPFAYLRTREIAFEDIDYQLTPAEAWHALETLHGLPLTLWDAGTLWQEHATPEVFLFLVNRVDDAVIARLTERAAARANVFVYSWTPGQLINALAGSDIEVRGVRDTLVRRFQS